MSTLLRSPWVDQFDSLLAVAQSSLVVCAPFVGAGPCDRINRAVQNRLAFGEFELLMLTDLSRDNLLCGATDVFAIARLVETFSATQVRFLPSLHAKIYVADERQAVITSSNLTDNGISRNLEYGVSFTEPKLVRQVRVDVLDYARLGSPISIEQLRTFAEITAELRDVQRSAERSIKTRLRREFERRVRQADDEIIRVRAAGRSPHAIFADAILHLLRRGALATVQLHQRIKEIHPDLCDDTVDRVIDGRHFGKKWKHAVRSAQVALRRRGEIELADGYWRSIAS